MSEFNYACNKCPRTFKLAEFYEKHRKVHELKKQHVCNICGFVYGAAKGLEGHLKSHESDILSAESKGVNLPPNPASESTSTSPSLSPQVHGTGNYRVYDLVPDVNDGAYQNGIGYYVCELCSREFSGLNSLKKHMPIHSRSIQHKCDTCGFVYGKKEYLTEHSRLHTGSLACEICGQLFSKSSKLAEHLKCHKNGDGNSKNEIVSYRCHICQDIYAEASQLKAHLESAHTPSSFLNCDVCPASFGNVKEKSVHMNTEHRMGPLYDKCLFCPLCSQGFARRHNLKMHMYKVHGKETIENNFNSEELAGLLSSRPLSGEDSPSKNLSLKATHYFDEAKGTQMLSCNLCSETFLRKNDLWIHLESTHGAVLPVCRVCEDKFSDLAELKEHIELSHEKRKPGPASKTNAHPLNRNESCQCPECGLILAERLSLTAHIKIAHGGGTESGGHCELCQKDFPSLMDLEAHQKGKHPNLNKRLQNLRDALFPEPKKMKFEEDDEDAHKAETDIIALNHHHREQQERQQQRPETETNQEEEKQAVAPQDEEYEEDLQYAPIMEDFYFEDMIIHPCYVVIPFVSGEEIEAACSKSQQYPPIDDFDEDQGRLTIDEGSCGDDSNPELAKAHLDTPFTGEQETNNGVSKNYNADDIKVETPNMGFYPDNISDYSLPFTLSGLWKKKADILGPNAMKQADLLEKQIKKINDYEKRQAEKRIKRESEEERSPSSSSLPLQNSLKRTETPELSTTPASGANNNNYIPHHGKRSKATQDMKYQQQKINSLNSSLDEEMDGYDLYPGPQSKGHRVKTSPHKAPDANVSKYESQIQQNHWPVECIKCDLKLNDLQCFNIHMNDHWTGDKCCPVCKLLINSKRFNFKQHLKIHTGEKPFVCDICKRSFRQKAHMVKHVTTHRSLSAAQIKVEIPAALSVN